MSLTPNAYGEPMPFRAVYKAKYQGLGATGIRELTRTEEGNYLLKSDAKAFIASINEQTLFSLNGDQIQPIEYQYHRKVFGRKKSEIVTFDWDSQKVLQWDLKVPSSALDRLSYQFAMRADLIKARESGDEWPAMVYQVAERGHMKEYRFEVVGEEVVDTPLGAIDTVRVTRLRENQDRITNFWLAPAYDFLLVRFEQIEEGDGWTLMLKEAQLGGHSLEEMLAAGD